MLQQGSPEAARCQNPAPAPLDTAQQADLAQLLVPHSRSNCHSRCSFCMEATCASSMCDQTEAALCQSTDTQSCTFNSHARLSSIDWISAGLKARGVRTDAHVSVNSVVERMLAAEAEEAATSVDSLPSPETATSPHLPGPSKQKQGDLIRS